MTTTRYITPLSRDLCTLLPADARTMLARAAQEAKGVQDPLARAARIGEAIARVKFNYPSFFKE